MSTTRRPLQRLLTPATVAVAGGRDAAEVIRQCRRSGFAGEIWAINPGRETLEGLRCYPDVASLPAAPDASFLAVPREQTVALVTQLAGRGAGGAVCYASGFAEVGPEGAQWQDRLLHAAGPMAILGPNCYGLLNHLDGCALWPDRAGGERVGRGVAILTQSGNIGLNLTMQGHHLPVAYMIALGNMAQVDFAQAMDALLDDPRVSAIGLHMEGFTDVAAFSRVALRALAQGVALVALKTGASTLGAQLTASHTSSMAGPDTLVDALFHRLGIARAHDLPEFLETLKLMHVCGPLAGARVGSLSCSGGEASLVADLGERAGIVFPPLPEGVQASLTVALGPKVPLSNPLDYHTYIWADVPALTRCFSAMLQAPVDLTLLVLDFPTLAHDGEDGLAFGWKESLDAFIAAHAAHPRPAALVSTLAELMPASAARRALAAGIAPMQGLRETMWAVQAAARLAERRGQATAIDAVTGPVALRAGPERQFTEVQAKQALAQFGIPVPDGRLVRSADEAAAAAHAIGFPVVVKAVSERLAHKSEAGAVALNLRDASQVRAAVDAMAIGPDPFDQWLVERMETGAVAELLVGVTRDPQFGLALTLGSGGVLVELLADATTLLLPARREAVARALDGLRCAPLLRGYRGRPAADLPALVDAIEAVLRFADAHADTLLELEINPLLALPHGAVAVDALLRIAGIPDPASPC